jgi:hypothetical protein
LRRIWFFWSHHRNFETHSSFEWCWSISSLVTVELVDTKLQSRCFGFVGLLFSSCFDKLIDSRHMNKMVDDK